METQQKASATEDIASILLAATGGITREKLSSDGALSHDQLGRYISILLNSGMLVDQFGSLTTTAKGQDFVRMFVHLEYRASG
jgi:predicted transcriptional regulator